MAILSDPQFFSFINNLTKATKELIDNGSIMDGLEQDFNKFVKATQITETDQRFVSTVSLGSPQKTWEWQQVARASTAVWHSTIISMLPKTTLSSVYSYEYKKGKNDDTQRIQEEYNDNVNRNMYSMRNEMNVEVYKMINDGFNPAAQYLSPDLKAVFANDHFFTDEEPLATFDNLLPAVSPSLSVLRDVERRAWAFVDAEGKHIELSPKKILVKTGSTAAHDWKQIFFGTNYRTSSLTWANGVNIYTNGEYSIVESPFLVSDTAYTFLSDTEYWQIKSPFHLGVIDFPTIEWGAVHDNNTLTTQVTYVSYYQVWLKNIPIGVYGSQWA